MTSRMKSTRVLMMLPAVLCGALLVAACGAGATGPGTTTSGVPSGGTPKVVKSKPTAVPKITVALCQQLLTVAEANQIMKPPTAATTIRIDSTTEGGSCNYEYAQFKSVVSIVFHSYQQGQSLSAAASQISSRVPNATVKTTMVSGVGDQALFVSAKVSVQGITIWDDGLDVTYGNVLFTFANFNVPATSSDAAQLAALTQVAQLVLGRM